MAQTSIGEERAPLLRETESQSEPDGLPPKDTGRHAWFCVAACFLTEALIWGLPFSFGIFQQYYSTHALFSGHDSTDIATIGTSATGVMYFGAPIGSYFYDRFPRVRRLSSFAGLAIIIASIIAASFATEIWHLILTQGILYGIGGTMYYGPLIFYLADWFDRRKGLAFGILWSGTGTAGVGIPFLLEWMLGKYGFRTTLRVWGIAMLILNAPLVYFNRGRIPMSHYDSRQSRRRPSMRFLASSAFWALEVCNIIQSLGYFVPLIYLPSYASSIGLGRWVSTSTISAIHFAAMFSNVIVGFLVDRLHITTVILILTLSSGVTTFVLWGFFATAPSLLAFSILYGLFAGGFKSTWSGSAIEVINVSQTQAEMGFIMGFFPAGRGVGALISGPVSGEILKIAWSSKRRNGAFGTSYGPLVVLTSLSAVLSAYPWVLRQLSVVFKRPKLDRQ